MTVKSYRSGGWVGHLSTFSAYLIFGINIVVCKDMASADALSPLGVFTIRAAGASLLYWISGLFMPRENIDRKDYPKIFAASMLGLFITQVSFLYGIGSISPVDWSVITVLGPIFTMFTAAIVLKEPITFKKTLGVLTSFAGIVILILSGSHAASGADTSVFGVLMGLVNAFSFALYLGIFRPLIQKYSVVTFMKWMFLFSLAVSLPFTAKEIAVLDWSSVSSAYYLELSYLVVFSTVVAYFLIPLGQKYIRPTIVSMYSYLQPIIACVVSIWLGMDRITVLKLAAAAAVVVGVVIVSRSKGKADIAAASKKGY